MDPIDTARVLWLGIHSLPTVQDETANKGAPFDAAVGDTPHSSMLRTDQQRLIPCLRRRSDHHSAAVTITLHDKSLRHVAAEERARPRHSPR